MYILFNLLAPSCFSIPRSLVSHESRGGTRSRRACPGGGGYPPGDAEDWQDVEVVGFLDDDATLHGKVLLGHPVLGPISNLGKTPHDSIVVAIGKNETRRKIAARLVEQGERLVAAVHPRAVLGTNVSVGAGAMICAGVVVNTASRIGSCAILNTGCTVDHHNVIGDYAHIAPGAHLGGDVTVGAGAFVCIGAAVASQRTVGAWSTVGAGAAVIRDVPDAVTVVGVPAAPLRRKA